MLVKTEASAEWTRRIWLALIGAVVLVAALMLWMSARMSERMSAAASTDEQGLANARPGSKVKFVLEVADVSSAGALRGSLLQKKTEEIYTRTHTSVLVQSTPATKLVMGKQQDLHSAAVVHVTGAVRKDHSLDAEQIVILTPYIRVE